MGFIASAKVLVKAFPYKATYHKWQEHGNNAENDGKRVIHERGLSKFITPAVLAYL
jgi:hypothetical protein